MTQEEEVLVSKHLTPEELEAFQKGQAAFYGELLSLWHIPEEKLYAQRIRQSNPLGGSDLQLGGPIAPIFLPGGIRTDGPGPGHRPFQISGLAGGQQ